MVCVTWGIMVLRMEQWFATVTIPAPLTLPTAVMTMQCIAVRKDNFYSQQKHFLLSLVMQNFKFGENHLSFSIF